MALELKTFVIIIIGCFGLGGLLPFVGNLIFRHHQVALLRLSLGFAILGSGFTLYEAFFFWHNPSLPGKGEKLFSFGSWVEGLPEIAPGLYLDRLAVFFLALVAGFALLIAFYSLSWLAADAEKINGHYTAGAYNFFVLATLLTIISNDVFFYLCCLEGITLSFSYLALYRHKKYLISTTPVPSTEQVATKTAFKAYLIFNHTGVIFVTAALVILSAYQGVQADAFNFDNFREAKFQVPSLISNLLIFPLGLIGFSIKAGIFPFHVWVTKVHPYSPTSIHAMLSGVILKVAGIYGMLRLFFDFLGPEWWWGLVVLILGGLTALVGVFYALVSRDLKTALASHSVENLGIILAGVGLALLFLKYNSDLAKLALIASLYHVLNHAVFKGLLFLCTGAIENRTGTVRFDRLGGLMKLYPWTSLTFLIGAISISGFPPFNGFVSEWLTLQVLFAGMGTVTESRFLVQVVLVIGLLLLSTAFGLTALAFVKIVGETLLGQSAEKSPDAAASHQSPGRAASHNLAASHRDVPWPMRSVLVFLAVACLLLGLFPAFVIGKLWSATASLKAFNSAASQPNFDTAAWSDVTVKTPNLSYQADLSFLLLLFLALMLIGSGLVALFRQYRKKTSSSLPWNGGTTLEADKMRITSSAFISPVRSFLSREIVPEKQGPPEYLPSRLPISDKYYVVEIFCVVYNYALNWLLRFSNWLGGGLQNGDIRRYLIYIFLTFILLLLLAFTQWKY